MTADSAASAGCEVPYGRIVLEEATLSASELGNVSELDGSDDP